jgi:hypothetical protein
MATFELFEGGRADLTGLAGCTTCGVPALAKQPLRPAGHRSQAGYFLQKRLDFTNGVKLRRMLACNAVAVNDVIRLITVPQDSVVLMANWMVDNPIPGFTFKLDIVDDAATGPVLDFGDPNVNRDDNVTTDDAPGVSAASTAVAVVASQVATSVIRKGIAIPIASQYMAEQAYLAMTILALPAGGSTDLLKNGGDMSVGLAIMAAQYASVE